MPDADIKRIIIAFYHTQCVLALCVLDKKHFFLYDFTGAYRYFALIVLSLVVFMDRWRISGKDFRKGFSKDFRKKKERFCEMGDGRYKLRSIKSLADLAEEELVNNNIMQKNAIQPIPLDVYELADDTCQESPMSVEMLTNYIQNSRYQDKPFFDGDLLEYNVSCSELVLLILWCNGVVELPSLYMQCGLSNIYTFATLCCAVVRLKKNGYIAEASNISGNDYPYYGQSKYVYVLTDKGASKIKEKLPLGTIYVKSSIYDSNSGKPVKTAKLLHKKFNVCSAMQVYSYLNRDGIGKDVGVNYECLLFTGQRIANNGYTGAVRSEDVRCDAALSWTNTAGVEKRILIEQDMFSEKYSVVMDKMKMYCKDGQTNYQNGILACNNATVVFSMHRPDTPYKYRTVSHAVPYMIVKSIKKEFWINLIKAIEQSEKERNTHYSANIAKEREQEWAVWAEEMVRQAWNFTYGEEVETIDKESGEVFINLVYKDTKNKYRDKKDALVACFAEVLRFYYELLGEYRLSASDAIRYHCMLPNADNVGVSKINAYALHYSASVQKSLCEGRFYGIVSKLISGFERYYDFFNRNIEVSDEYSGFSNGFSFFVVPTLCLGRYLPFISDHEQGIAGVLRVKNTIIAEIQPKYSKLGIISLYLAGVYGALTGINMADPVYFETVGGYPGAKAYGASVDVLCHDVYVRLRNQVSPQKIASGQKITAVCVENIMDMGAWIRVACYIGMNRQNKKGMGTAEYKADRKLIVIADSVDMIKKFSELTGLCNKFTGRESLQSEEDVAFVLIDDLQKLFFYSLEDINIVLDGAIRFYGVNDNDVSWLN